MCVCVFNMFGCLHIELFLFWNLKRYTFFMCTDGYIFFDGYTEYYLITFSGQNNNSNIQEKYQNTTKSYFCHKNSTEKKKYIYNFKL